MPALFAHVRIMDAYTGNQSTLGLMWDSSSTRNRRQTFGLIVNGIGLAFTMGPRSKQGIQAIKRGAYPKDTFRVYP